MKTKLLTLTFLYTAFGSTAQTFGPILFQPNYGNTTPNTIGMGVGTWPLSSTTNSRFHINNFLCNQPNGALNGLLFRTDGNIAVNNNWQLFTGINNTSLTEKFRISALAPGLFTNPLGNDVSISTMQNGNLLLNTNNSLKCTITTGAILNNNVFSSANGNFSGDGIKIAPGTGSAAFASLDLFSTSLNQTQIRMDGTALLQTASTRFEQYANLNGFWFNATGNSQFGVPNSFTPQFIFNIQSSEKGRLGSNGFWHFGNSAINAANMLEVQSNAATPYGITGSGLRFTNLTSANTPLANGVNGVNNQKVLTVDKNGDVVLTNPSGLNTADNGLSLNGPNPNAVHLGQNVGAIGNPGQLLNNRWVPMNNFNITFKDPASFVAGNNRIELGNISSVLTAGSLSYNPKLATCNIDNYYRRTAAHFSTIYDYYSLGTLPLITNPYYFGNIGGAYKFGLITLGVDSVNAGRAIGVSGFGYTNGSGAGSTAVGVSGKVFSNNATSTTFGVISIASGNAINTYGINSLADASGQLSIAGQFRAQGANAVNIAVSGWSPNTLLPYQPTTYPAGANIAIYGRANKNISGTPHSFAGFFDGDVWLNSSSVGTGFAQIVSDQQFKTNIDSIGSALKIITLLKPKHFYYDTLNNYKLNFSSKKQYGLLAQDVQTILPELVSNFKKPAIVDSLGNKIQASITLKTMAYEAFIAIIIKGMQEQQTKMDSMKVKINKQDSISKALQNQINAIITTYSTCCSNTTPSSGNKVKLNQFSIQLGNEDIIVLSQNVPNPFAEQTIINYNVPTDFKTAQIIFNTTDGRILKVHSITTKGAGQLNVFANDLSSGMYSYYLIVDGNIIDTKKMVKN
ncbi:MAG: tail fiber domain-containing protein [Bacteroidetes bacterium]|nr:tail fiber domain-containing protein [Bacteroidota bacterium]